LQGDSPGNELARRGQAWVSAFRFRVDSSDRATFIADAFGIR